MGRYQCLWRFRTDFSISWDDSSVLTPERWQPLLWFHILCTILSTLSNMKQKISTLSFWIIKSYFKYVFSSPEGCLSDNFTERHSRFVLLFRGPLLCSWSVEEPDVSQCLGAALQASPAGPHNDIQMWPYTAHCVSLQLAYSCCALLKCMCTSSPTAWPFKNCLSHKWLCFCFQQRAVEVLTSKAAQRTGAALCSPPDRCWHRQGCWFFLHA